MKPAVTPLALSTLLLATAAWAGSGETRSLGAHVHGQGALNIAVEGQVVLMELEAPGADIVGFEHAATSAEDKAAVEAAKAKLAEGGALFVLAPAAGCELESAEVELIAEGGDHGDHGHGEHGHDDHGHDEHAHDDHGHDDHGHDDHGHDEHAHDDHAHGDEEAGEGHTEFHAEYRFGCDDTAQIAEIAFPYFEAFPNAEKLEIQMITGKGSTGFEVERAEPRLTVSGAI